MDTTTKTNNQTDELKARKRQLARKRALQWMAGRAAWEDRVDELHAVHNGEAPAAPAASAAEAAVRRSVA